MRVTVGKFAPVQSSCGVRRELANEFTETVFFHEPISTLLFGKRSFAANELAGELSRTPVKEVAGKQLFTANDYFHVVSNPNHKISASANGCSLGFGQFHIPDDVNQ